MEKVKRIWLPKVIMSGEAGFEEAWAAYMKEYETSVDVESYIKQLNLEIQKRVDAAVQ